MNSALSKDTTSKLAVKLTVLVSNDQIMVVFANVLSLKVTFHLKSEFLKMKH